MLAAPLVQDGILDQIFNLKPYAHLKILGLFADEAACGHYRVIYPLQSLQAGGAQVTLASTYSHELLQTHDIILAQRQYGEAAYHDLLDAKLHGKTLIYEIDDNVHAVHPGSVAYNIYKPGSQTLRNVDRFLSIADGFFTTSPELASQYRNKCDRVWVLPNQIDFGIRAWGEPGERDPKLLKKLETVRERSGREPVVIGWAGSITHQDDWQELRGLGETLRRHPEAIFCMVSAYQIMEKFARELELPRERVVCLQPVEFEEYPTLLRNFDVTLAPVINTPFNIAKRDLKIVEGGAWGLPYVASRIAPYQRYHLDTQGQGGFIANTAREWDDALGRLITEPELRRSMGEFQREYVRTHRNIQTQTHLWAEAFEEARAAKFRQPDHTRQYHVPSKPGRNDLCPCGSGVKHKKCPRGCYGAWG